MRKRVNRALEKCMPLLNGLSYRHVDLEGGYPGLYRPDGVHLSEVGLDIFNLGLQYSIESAVGTAVGGAGLEVQAHRVGCCFYLNSATARVLITEQMEICLDL